MLWTHPDHEGRGVRLAYCLNLHAAATLDETLAGIRAITLPLRDRLSGGNGSGFGVGLYLPAGVAVELSSAAGADDLERLARFVVDERLDPFTYNAFPYGGFHEDGLKSGVFRPTWLEDERVAFTVAVARIAERLSEAVGNGSDGAHVSISTHPGAFGSWLRGPDDVERIAERMADAADELAQVEERSGRHLILSVEAEPRASAGDTRELAEFLLLARRVGADRLVDREGMPAGYAQVLMRRHLGTCLDCCHSAVELEEPTSSLRDAAAGDGPIGKLQFSSALTVHDPGSNPDAVEALLAMDEPRYLHQVTGGGGPGPARRVDDLPELRAALEGPDREAWLACSEWRCHFHVPVDLGQVGGLGTTRDHADRILEAALAEPATWRTRELHLEIETYTWDVLPGPARTAGDLVDGLEREYRHVMGRLERAGWRRA